MGPSRHPAITQHPAQESIRRGGEVGSVASRRGGTHHHSGMQNSPGTVSASSSIRQSLMK